MTPSAATVAAATAVLREHGRSFSLASALLPRDVRARAAVLYALCRTIDDLADEAEDPVAAEEALAPIEQALRNGTPLPGFLGEAASVLDPAGRLAAAELVRGVRSDLGPVRIADDAALRQYAYRVAGTVGEMMCPLLGASPEAISHAVELGIAMQLTNIARDVAEDAVLDRVYLPADRLRAHGIEPSPRGVLARPEATARVVAEILDLAEVSYDEGLRGLPFLPLRVRLGIAVAAVLYRRIGRRARRLAPSSVLQRTVLPLPDRVLAVLDGVAVGLGLG